MLLNKERARAIMSREHIDALMTLDPVNSYYLSGYWSKAMGARWRRIAQCGGNAFARRAAATI